MAAQDLLDIMPIVDISLIAHAAHAYPPHILVAIPVMLNINAVLGVHDDVVVND